MKSRAFFALRSLDARDISRALLLASFTGAALVAASCSSDDTPAQAASSVASTGSAGGKGGASGSTGGAGGTGGEMIPDGEVCETPSPVEIKARFEPAQIFVPPCPSGSNCVQRSVDLIVDPDFCTKTPITFTSSNNVVPAPPDDYVDLHRAKITLSISGRATAGESKITVHVPKGDGTDATADLDVQVLDPTPVACSGTASMAALSGGQTLNGTAGLAGASIGLQKGAEKPNSGSFLWHVDPFDAAMKCASDIVPPGYMAIGPAIDFGPETQVMKREIPLSVPINPALMPSAARWRHLRFAYTGPSFKAPRTVPVADPQIAQVNGQWAVTFKVPRLGTYQAVVATDAGTHTFTRHLTHRAVTGISMGGGGTQTFGMRHHDKFDVIAPLGGFQDWTWLTHFITDFATGGFRPIAPGTTLADIQLASTPCTVQSDCKTDETCLFADVAPGDGRCVLLAFPPEPYEHGGAFNNIWYEYPNKGTGGTFARDGIFQILRDLSIMYGNPSSDNLTPGAEELPAGVPPTDKSVVGDHPGNQCQLWVDPVDTDANYAEEQEIAANCPTERCSHTLTMNNYFDRKYNPDGTFPVITFCDGSPQNPAFTPYSDTWSASGNNYPVEVALAVDYNGNGVRDELEPVIGNGSEPYSDFGVDGVPDAMEPGYAAGVNDDPNGDDYDPQYNPSGTEKDYRWEQGEPFEDVGIDGVAGTKQQPPGGWQAPGDGYDVGEGDGKFTASRGLQRFWDRDSHSIVRNMVDPAKIPGGALDDAALQRLDFWTDGGTRDIENFGVIGRHFVGDFVSRNRDAAYFTDFINLPGLNATTGLDPKQIVWDDLQSTVLMRYGKIDPTQADIDDGSGQHVGTATEIISRVQTAIYYIMHRWNEPELKTLTGPSGDDPSPTAQPCELTGNCTVNFTSPTNGRVGPVGISLPPGYARRGREHIRYPVLYLLHGYGQNPTDLEAIIVVLNTWMNSATDSGASRLPKAIIVYPDGRCRSQNGKAECLRGNFFADSPMAQGSQDETWWLDLMDYMDQNFRTMGDSDVTWTE